MSMWISRDIIENWVGFESNCPPVILSNLGDSCVTSTMKSEIIHNPNDFRDSFSTAPLLRLQNKFHFQFSVQKFPPEKWVHFDLVCAISSSSIEFDLAPWWPLWCGVTKRNTADDDKKLLLLPRLLEINDAERIVRTKLFHFIACLRYCTTFRAGREWAVQ